MKLARQLTLAIVVVGATIAVCSSGGVGVRAPALVRFVAPNYPSGANATVSEQVTALVTVNADGTVREVTIRDSANTPLEEAVVNAVRKWVFIPAMKGGKVVACQISIPFAFESQSRELTVDLGNPWGE
jgi:TonB family protein